MEFRLSEKVTISTTNRHQEFLDAIVYLLDNFPPDPARRIYFKFLKKDGVNFNANADYDSADHIPGLKDSTIRVSYGKEGRDKKALEYLFHEYKHLLQDEEGYLFDLQFAHFNHCIEAQAWAEEKLAIYAHSMTAVHGDFSPRGCQSISGSVPP